MGAKLRSKEILAKSGNFISKLFTIYCNQSERGRKKQNGEFSFLEKRKYDKESAKLWQRITYWKCSKPEKP